MSGFPYYNDTDQIKDERIFLSDILCNNSMYIVWGFVIGCSFIPNSAVAADLPVPANFTAAPTPSPAAQTARLIMLAGACGVTAKCGNSGLEWAANVAKGKAVENPKAAAIVGCIFMTGWCIGRTADRLVERIL